MKVTKPMTCPHDSDEMWKATDAGMCPLCQKAEIARLNDALTDYHRVKELGRADAAEVKRLRAQLHYANGTCDLAMKHRDTAEADNARLKAALQWYADGDTWCKDVGGYGSAIHQDGGKVARRALEPKP